MTLTETFLTLFVATLVVYVAGAGTAVVVYLVRRGIRK